MREPDPKERMTVHIPSSLKKEVEQKAATAGQTLSIWIERAIRAVLAKVAS